MLQVDKIKLLEQGDDEGFRDFRVSGSVDGKPFEGVVGLEIDGRDADYEHEAGEDVSERDDAADLLEEIYEKIYETDEYKSLCPQRPH